MRKQYPAIRLSALVGRPQFDALMGHTDPAKDFAAIAKETGAGIISPDWEMVTPEQVAAAHSAGTQVAPGLPILQPNGKKWPTLKWMPSSPTILSDC